MNKERNKFFKNWHFLDWQTEEQIKKRKTVDKRGVISNTPITMEMKYPFILSKINVEIFILLNPYFSSITKILYN